MKLPTNFYRSLVFNSLLLVASDGLAATYTISGKVFYDRNKNGNPEVSEAGIRDIYIRLFYSTDFGRWNALNAQTNSSGTYSFSVELQSWETGFKYSVLELGPNPGPTLKNINPKDFNHVDPDIPGGFNGTTTLRRYSGPDAIVMRSYTHHFGHVNFKPFSPALPNALIVGSEGEYSSPSSIFGINLSTGNTTRLLDSINNPIKDPIVGLGYHQKTNTFMGCTIKDGRPGWFVIIENTSPLTITKLPLGENAWFYMWAYHGVDISSDGFMVDFAAGTGYTRSIFDMRPTSVNFLQRVDRITKKFNPAPPDPFDAADFAVYSDFAFNPINGLMYSIDPSGGGILKRRGSIYEPPVSLGPIIFESGLPIPSSSHTLTYFDNTNHLFVISIENNLLYKIDVSTRIANVVSSFPKQLNNYMLESASNPNVTIPVQTRALRQGLPNYQNELLSESVVIRPNPTVGKRVSVSHETGIDAVEMFNKSGQKQLHQKAFGKKNIDISLPSNTASGNYLIRIVGSDGKIVTKNIVVD